MSKKVFISYRHAQHEWVFSSLVPVLRAGGAEVLIDKERFEGGKSVIGQMDDLQDKSDIDLLLFTPDYLESDFCVHEMKRALVKDPTFTKGHVLPVILEQCKLPVEFTGGNAPLYVNLQNHNDPDSWSLVMKAVNVELGVNAVEWLHARDEIKHYLADNQSVNLVVTGRKVKYYELIDHLAVDHFPDLGCVDLERGATVTRQGLIGEILKACQIYQPVPDQPNDLVFFDRKLSDREHSRIALVHFDLVKKRNHYQELDLFTSIRYLINRSRKLSLLVHSREPFVSLLPEDHPLSSITTMKLVELEGQV